MQHVKTTLTQRSNSVTSILGAIICVVSVAAGAEPPAPVAKPMTGPDLVLWLDAQDIRADGGATADPPDGAAVAAWVDKSGHHHHARQKLEQIGRAHV